MNRGVFSTAAAGLLLAHCAAANTGPWVTIDRTRRVEDRTIGKSGESFTLQVAGHADPIMRRLEIAGPVVDPKVVCDRWIDPETPTTVLSSILKPGMTQREKAYAVFWYCQENFSSAVPYLWDEGRFASALGFGHCGPRNYAQQALANAAGVRWHPMELKGHNCFEYWFDGRWNMLDVHERGIYPDPTGLHPANGAELAASRELILRNADADMAEVSSVEYPPERVRKYQEYVLGVYGSFKGGTPEVTGKRFPWDDNKIAYRLRAGERIIFWWDRPRFATKWRGEPHIQDSADPSDFTNPQLIYEPDLASSEAKDGVSSSQNIRWEAATLPLHVERPGQPASVVWEISSYYNLMAGWIEGAFSRGSEDDVVRLSVSGDGGKTWKTAWEHQSTGVVSARIELGDSLPFVQPTCYTKGLRSYLARLEMSAAKDPAKVGVARIKFLTELLTYGRALPTLRLASNRLTVTASRLPRPLHITYEYDEVSSLRADRYDPTEGQPVHITAIVSNHGDTPARAVRVQFYDGDPSKLGKPIGEPVALPTIAPGASRPASLTWNCEASGDRGPYFTINSTIAPSPKKPYFYDFSRIYAVVNPDGPRMTPEQTAALPYLPLFVREKPRLLISDAFLLFLDETNQPGKVRVRATVRNACQGQKWIYTRGTTVKNVVVRFFDGDPAQPGVRQIGGDQSIPELGPLGFASVDVLWDVRSAAAGPHAVWVVVDPDHQIVEKDTRFPDRAWKKYEVRS